MSAKAFTTAKPIELPLTVISGLKIGESEDVTITFCSSTKPLSLIWTVGGRRIYYGAKASKYISREIVALKEVNCWNATLHIMDLTPADIELNYNLQIKNSLGAVDYHIKLEGCLEKLF